MHQDAAAFLHAVYEQTDGLYWTIWTIEAGSTPTTKRTYWLRELTHVDEVFARIPKDANVYSSIALAEQPGTPHERIRIDTAAGIVGLVADIDYGKPGALRTEDDARQVLRDVPHSPTLLVHSGHGLQAWWLFREAWIFDEPDERDRAQALSRGWQRVVDQAARYRGGTIDHVGDLARVMRVPGTRNTKNPETPVRVVLLDASGPRYSPSDFEDWVPTEDEQQSHRVEVKPVRMDGAVDPDRFCALIENVDEFRASWRHERPDIPDQSLSTYDLSLCSIAARAGWTDEELAALIRDHRRKYGDQIKGDRADYVARTIAKARTGIQKEEREAQAIQRLTAPESLTREQKIEALSTSLRIPIENIQLLTGSAPIMRFHMGDRVVELPQEALVNQHTWKARMFVLCGKPPRTIGKGESPSWDEYITIMVEVAEVVEVGVDATIEGAIGDTVREYLRNRPPLAVPEGEMVQRPETPFVRNGMVWFRLSDMLKAITLGSGERLSRTALAQRLRAIGAERQVFAVPGPDDSKHSTMSFYGVPAHFAHTEQGSDSDENRGGPLIRGVFSGGEQNMPKYNKPLKRGVDVDVPRLQPL